MSNQLAKNPPLDIGFECWLLDIRISRSLDTFSDGVSLTLLNVQCRGLSSASWRTMFC